MAVVGTVISGGCAGGGSKATGVREYAFWPPFPAEPRIQFLTSFATSADVQPERDRMAELIYGKQREVLPINKPYGLAMWEGKIYVCDSRNGVVHVLDLPKRQVRLIGAAGMARMSSPTAVAIAPDGKKYVSDHVRGAVFVFDAADRHVNSIGHPGFKPTGVAVFEDELFVCDFREQQVLVFDRHSGKELRRFGGQGDEDGRFIWPLGIAADRHGNVYVSDVLRCRIQKFSREGRLLGAWGQAGETYGSFVRPKLLAVDRDGIVYVIDAAFQNVQMFDDRAAPTRLLTFFGGAGAHPGSMSLPAGVAVVEADRVAMEHFRAHIHPAFNAERLLLVSNQFGPHKVSVYAFGRLKEGYTAQDVATAAAPVDLGVYEGPAVDPLVDELPVEPAGDPDPEPPGPAPESGPRPADEGGPDPGASRAQRDR